eukprot:1159616-Pelagomonas_calceolata.AAC.1
MPCNPCFRSAALVGGYSDVCSLRRTYAQLLSDFPSSHRNFLDESGTFYYSKASSEDVSHSLQKQTNETYRFISDLVDIFRAVGTVEQAEQPTTWLKLGQLSRPSSQTTRLQRCNLTFKLPVAWTIHMQISKQSGQRGPVRPFHERKRLCKPGLAAWNKDRFPN